MFPRRTADTAARRRGKVVVLCCLALLACAAAGCASAPRSEPLTVTLKLDAEQYDVGQPIVATVSIKNDSSAPFTVPSMDSSTLTFYLGREGEAARMKRWPVLPEDVPADPRVIRCGGVDGRSFLFTQATTAPGKWGMIVSLSNCLSPDESVRLGQPFFSAPVWFQVSEEVKFKRDPYSGIIVKEQAVELARAHAQVGASVPARAVLVPLGSSGLVMWTVFFGDDAVPGKQKEFTVNPYTGKVEPLDSQTEEGEKR